MSLKDTDYFRRLIGYINTFMDVIDEGIVAKEKAMQNMQDAIPLADEVMLIPKDKRIEAIKNSFVGIEILRVGQHRVVTYKGKAFQVKSNGKPKRIEDIYQPLDFAELQNFLLSNAIYNKIMKENRQ